MGNRHPNPRLAKIHRSYTVEEIASLLGIHKNTIRTWVKQGNLPTCDNQRPMLILGFDLREFLYKKRTKNKCPLKPGEIYCVRCHAAKIPHGNLAEYQPLKETHGNLIGICPTCENFIYRCISLLKIEQVRGKLEILMPQALLHINESDGLSVNSDLKEGT